MPPPGPVSAPPLIGRERELAAVRAFLERHSGTLLISGEAGIGKTRLLRECISLATADGYLTLQGACFERDQALPLAPFLDLVRGDLVAHPAEVQARLASMAPNFVRLMPELSGETIASEPVPDSEQEQRRLVHELSAHVASLAAEQPVILAIEDIHWSDELSLDLLLHLTRRASTMPLTLLATYRGDEPRATLDHFLAEIDRGRLASEVELRPLSPTEVERQVRAILDLRQPASANFVRSLHGLTGGNPFFVEEVVRSLIASGDIFPSHEGWQRRPLAQLRVPRSVGDAVRRRSALLSPTARDLLTLAAVIGRRIDFALLQSLSGLGEEALLAAIKELIAAQLMVEATPDRFAFRHALTREAVYAALLARERRALHARVARALDDGCAGEPEGKLEDLAYHTFAAADWERARHLSRQAGHRARALSAPFAAVDHYSRALEATTRLGLGPDAELLLDRAQMFDAIGDFAAAATDFEAALAAAEASHQAEVAISALMGLGLLWSGRNYERALTWLTRAIALARGTNDPAALASALNRLGNWHTNHEEIDEALHCHQEALAIFTRLNDRGGTARTLDLLAMAHVIGGDVGTAISAARQAATLFLEIGDRIGYAGISLLTVAPAAAWEMETLVGGEPLGRAIATLEQALALAREIDLRSGEAFTLGILAQVQGAAGDAGAALANAAASLAIGEEIDHRQWILLARWVLGRLSLSLLAPDRAKTDFQAALAMARDIHSQVWISHAAAGLALTLLALGELDAAEMLLAEILEESTPARTQGQRLLWTARAELALAQGEPSDALAIVDRLYAAAIGLEAESDVPRLALIKAAALRALNQAATAEPLLRAAQATARQQEAAPMLRELHLALADLLREQNRNEEAAAEALAAREIARRVAATMPEGGPRRGYLRATGIAVDALAESPKSAASELTPREREVAAQIAAGRSNREIAGELFVSERTIEAHVANMLRKLAVPARAGIAAWVERESAGRGT